MTNNEARASIGHLFPGCGQDEEYPADRYAKAVLAAFEQPFCFVDGVRGFLARYAVFIVDNVYHLGNSSVWYRTVVPPELDDYGNATNIALNFIARSKSELEESMATILEKFPVFEEYSDYPDPLFLTSLPKRNSDKKWIN